MHICRIYLTTQNMNFIVSSAVAAVEPLALLFCTHPPPHPPTHTHTQHSYNLLINTINVKCAKFAIASCRMSVMLRCLPSFHHYLFQYILSLTLVMVPSMFGTDYKRLMSACKPLNWTYCLYADLHLQCGTHTWKPTSYLASYGFSATHICANKRQLHQQ